MAWNGLNLTVEGRNILNRAQLSGKMNLKAIVIGDGHPPDNFNTVKRLTSQLYEITDFKVDMTEGECTLTADLPRVEYDYYFREVGVIAAGEDGDVLYVYDNCGEDAQYIVNTTNAEKTAKRIRLVLKISNVEMVSAPNPGILYVDYEVFEQVTGKLQETIETLKYPEYQESEKVEELHSGESIFATFGKLKRTVLEFILHEGNQSNPHQVTKAQVGLGNADDTPDAQKPVSAAQRDAIDKAAEASRKYADEAVKAAEEALSQTDSTKVSINGGNISDTVVDFTEAGTLAKLLTGEKTGITLGKIAKAVTSFISHAGNKGNPHGVTKAQVGLGNVNNTADAQKPVSAAQQKAINDAYANSNYYTDERIADLINGAPTTLDTLKEIADAMEKNQDVVEALDKSVGSKVDINGGDISYTVAEFTEASALSRIQGGEMTKSIFSKTAKAISALISHISTAATASVLGHVKVDSALSSTSTNPVQNKAVHSALAGKLSTSGNASNTTSTFTEASSLTELVSGERHSVSMGKLKLAVKNVIAIAKLLGNTDISKIGGGTVTGAIAGINSSLGKYFAYEGTDHNLIVPASVFNISRAQLEATDIPEGYYTVINLLKHPNNTEGVQYAIGYFGGDCVGKMFYRTFANHQVTSQFKEVAMCNGTESINVSTEIRKDDVEAFSKANFIASKPPGSPNMCGYGFHNAGTNGCILYYSETDSHLHILNNVGRDYVISMTEVSK